MNTLRKSFEQLNRAMTEYCTRSAETECKVIRAYDEVVAHIIEEGGSYQGDWGYTTQLNREIDEELLYTLMECIEAHSPAHMAVASRHTTLDGAHEALLDEADRMGKKILGR